MSNSIKAGDTVKLRDNNILPQRLRENYSGYLIVHTYNTNSLCVCRNNDVGNLGIGNCLTGLGQFELVIIDCCIGGE